MSHVSQLKISFMYPFALFTWGINSRMWWKKNPIRQLCGGVREQSLYTGTGKMVACSCVLINAVQHVLHYGTIFSLPSLWIWKVQIHFRWKWVNGDPQLCKSCLKLLWTSYSRTRLLFWIATHELVVHQSIHQRPASISKNTVKEDVSARNPADLDSVC